MKAILFFGLAIFWSSRPTFAQPKLDRVRFIPEYPIQGQQLRFWYKRDSSIFHDDYKVRCRIYFTGTRDRGKKQQKFPELFVPILIQENGEFWGSFVVPERATGIVVVFLDSLKAKVDNNNGEGYWTPVFVGRDVLPGSLSDIADLYAGGWPPTYHLEPRRDIARKLYETDFNLHPDIKRKFSRFYLATFDIHDAKDKALFKEELNKYSHYSDLDEWELLDVKKYYSSIDEVDSAKKYNKLVFDRYPNGSWALQVNSLKSAIQVDEEKDELKRWEMYLGFKKSFGGGYPDDFTRKLMNDRLGQLLRGMVVGFSGRNDLMTWEAEVNSLDEASRFFTYRRAAVFIAETVKASVQLKGSGKLGHFRPESALWQSTASEEQLLVYAEHLARESSEWYRKYLDEPHNVMNEGHLTDQEVRSRRALQLALALDAWAQVLTLQQNPAKALEVLREAVRQSNYTLSDINEHYIELLVRNNHIEEAKREASHVVRVSRSTPAIHEFYAAFVKDSSELLARASLEERLRKEMIREELPISSIVDSEGKTVSLNALKGKTIVLDFWATWCAPCIFGLELMAPFVEQQKNRDDLLFLFVNTDKAGVDTKKLVEKKFLELGYRTPVYFDQNLQTSKNLKVAGLPTLVIIDSKGKIRFRHLGMSMTVGKQQLMDELIAMIELARK